MATAIKCASAVIIGFGNPLCGDDGFGCAAAEVLGEQYSDDAGISVIATHQLTPELAADLAEVGRVVFIDASASVKVHEPVGTIRCEKVSADSTINVHGHSLSPSALLSLTDQLYGRTPDALLITVSGARFDLGCSLSDDVRAQIPRIMDLVAAFL